MLFCIDEFPERLHHPKESGWLWPRVRARCPGLAATLDRLDANHGQGKAAIRELEHALRACEVLGERRRQSLVEAMARHIDG